VNPKISAMVFDADGVIVRPKSWFVTGAFERYNVPKDEFMAFIHGDFTRCTTGDLKLEDALPPLLNRWGVTVGVTTFIQQWLEHERAVDVELLERIGTIRASGLPCYLGTNQEANRAGFMRNAMGLEAALDGVFASCDLGARKPNPNFYERVQNHLELPPEEILLWDDNTGNVAAAQAAGWHAELYTTREAFEAQLTPYLEP
jgi:putative hydrolase of the HAD superfamily